uniref:Phospholipase A2 n=1 Tax=Hirondellea gigas TaxID=1518452 RepID=A0A2P2I3R9_9CRUS
MGASAEDTNTTTTSHNKCTMWESTKVGTSKQSPMEEPKASTSYSQCPVPSNSEEPQSPTQHGTANTNNFKNRFRNFRPPKLTMKTVTSELLRSRTTSTMWDTAGLDPFQVFAVEHESCLDFQIVIHKGENITKGSALQDYIDTPDPYVILKVPGSSNSSKRTTQLDNTTMPHWDQTFHFYLDPAVEHTLHVTLMDANITLDETLGEDTFIINTLTNDVELEHTFMFAGGSKLHATLLITKNKNPDLRFSLALCEKERAFLQIRRKKVLIALQKLIGDRAPHTDKQVPIIAVLGSGGGFRAMICLSGAVRALYETGVLDCTTYISGLSGSSWYISSLYSHGTFAEVTPDTIEKELRESVTSGWKWKLTNSLGYMASMLLKYRNGQPISFTDFFGHLLGDVLLKERKGSKLTDQRRIVDQGTVPFPLYTCLHAKRAVSCRAFSEWVEFSPYEIGIAKYGTFMKTEHFGSKFMVGKLIKEHPESPLHFLQGVWGSAFTILIKRLVLEGGSANKDMVQMMRENAGAVSERELNDEYDAELVGQQTDSDTEDEEDIVGKDDIKLEGENSDEEHKKSPNILQVDGLTLEDKKPGQITAQSNLKEKPVMKTLTSSVDLVSNQQRRKCQDADAASKNRFSFDFTTRRKSKDAMLKSRSLGDSQVETSAAGVEGDHKLKRTGAIKCHSIASNRRQSKISDTSISSKTASTGTKKWAERRESRRAKREEVKLGFMSGLKQSLMTGANVLNSRAGRAGEILNPFRGLSLKNSFPISPFAETLDDDEDEVDSDAMTIGAACRYQQLDNTAKKLFIVDSGLAFNSPYPLLLRPQRAVDIYLSFDFSMRKTDDTPPFKELILAEKWACQNKVPFPPIEKQSLLYAEEGYVREVYVFKNEDDPFCPVILHFPLVNQNFKTFKVPGVPRTTQEEIDFANFEIFNDKSNVYSSTNFVYEDIQFDRMTKLVEFNTLFCLDTIKDELALAVKRKRENIAKMQVGLNDVVALMTRVKSVRRSKKGTSGLRLNIAPDKEKKLMTMLKQQEQMDRQLRDRERDSFSSDASDYSDCVDFQSPSEEYSSPII